MPSTSLPSTNPSHAQWAGAIQTMPLPLFVKTISTAPPPSEQLYSTKLFTWLLDSGASRHITGRLGFL